MSKLRSRKQSTSAHHPIVKLVMAVGGALDLPLDAATQTFAFLGRKSSGKTYAAGKLVELLFDAGVQVVVIDTVGNWYGLRLGVDGTSPGLAIPVIGGLRGDIPIEESSGELIANMLADTGSSAVLDISQFSLSARQRFATAFGERLWLRKKSDHHPRPLHLVIEESQLIIPQLVRPGQQRMVGIYEEIVRLGRNYGIGVSMVSQRPQSVNKEVLNQTECLFVFQTAGPQERDALHKWVVTQGGDTHLVRELPSLPTGTGYVWSPQWLRKFERVTIALKRTFDSSATPKVGVKVIAGELMPLYLDKLRAQMHDVIERAKAEDPRELRKQITALRRELEAERKKIQEPKVSGMPIADQEILRRISAQLVESAAELSALPNGIRLLQEGDSQRARHKRESSYNAPLLVVDDVAAPTTPEERARLAEWFERDMATGPGRVHHLGDLAELHVKPPVRLQEPQRRARSAASRQPALGPLPSAGGQRRMLTAFAQRPTGLSMKQLGVRAGMSSRSGTFARYLTHFRAQGWIVGSKSGMQITEAGLAALGQFEPLPEGRDLLGHWLSELGNGGLSRILSVVASAYPKELQLDEVCRRADMAKSGTFARYVTKLRSLELVEGRGALRASDELFGGSNE